MAVVLTVENDFSANGQLETTYQSIDKILFRTNLKKKREFFLKAKIISTQINYFQYFKQENSVHLNT